MSSTPAFDDDDVQRAEPFERRVEQAVDVGGASDVRLHREDGPARLFDGGDGLAGLRLAGRVVDDDVGAERCVALGDRAPDAACRAGDERCLVVQGGHDLIRG